MKLPKKVNILSSEYSVVYCDTLADVSRDETMLHWGQCDHKNGEIRVFRYPSDVATVQALVHEVIHCYEYAFGLSMDEEQVNFLAAHFVDFLVRNKVEKWTMAQK